MTGPTRGTSRSLINCRIRDYHPLWFRIPSDSSSRQICNSICEPHNPAGKPTVWADSFSLAATREVAFAFSSCGYLDVSVPHVRPVCLCIQHTVIQGSWDQRLFDSFPRLFAAFHALHRLLAPRHPPHALSSLTTIVSGSPVPFPQEERVSMKPETNGYSTLRSF